MILLGADGLKMREEKKREGKQVSVGGDVRGAAAVARGLGPLDVQVEQLHLSEGNSWLQNQRLLDVT